MSKVKGLSPETLEAALGDMRAALRAGNYAALPQIVSIIEERAEGLTQKDPATAVEVRAMAARNATLLQAALRGMRAAQRRVAEISSAAKGLQTYDGFGKACLLANGQNRFKQRF
jgi:hypothetical protein